MNKARPRVAVAASGGRDSTALLHCTLRTAQPLGVEVVALHVHHGLVPEADDWLAQVRRQSRRWGAAFDARRLRGTPVRGESVEAWARRERYAALAEMAHEAACPLVLLAHHRRDQAETFLLQALRGGGPAGLSAMPASAPRQDLVWARPWLELPRAAIEAYVRRHRLHHVDDASNADPRFARNRLRLQVWPALGAAFADAEPALAQAARQAQHAAALAAEVAVLDLPALRQGDTLALAPWALLPPARQRNALRAWLADTLGTAVPQSLLERLWDELPGRRVAAWPAPGGELRLYRGLLGYRPNAGAVASETGTLALDLSRPGDALLPAWGGHFSVTLAHEGGVPPALLQAPLSAGPRRGGERFHLAPRGAARSLKKQYQAAGVPAWQRSGPLLWLPDGRLLFAPGLGVDASLRAEPGLPQCVLRWCPGPPGPRQAGG
ncbi:MAG: tRNA lysidine(34) synthetase TilS [Rubrivivax sp.]|nr:tRNA lysidine(34) synthetase TilS [Rubrivivax sp.]